MTPERDFFVYRLSVVQCAECFHEYLDDDLGCPECGAEEIRDDEPVLWMRYR